MVVYFNYNGKFYKEGTPIVGPDNRGLRYGDGLFETLKVKSGKIIFADEHFARLWRGLKLMQFEIPKHFSPDLLEKEINALVQKNAHESLSRVRLNIFRSDGGLYDAKDLKPNYCIQSWNLPSSNAQWNSNGLVCGIYKDALKSCDAFCNLKHNNYLPYAMAALKAKAEKWNDAFLLNTDERICDSTIANIFLVKDEQVFTPLLSEGCVAGIMREHVIGTLKKNNYVITETAVSIDSLLNADEVFLTNSIQQLRWVQAVADKNYSNDFAQKIFNLLNEQSLL